MARKPVIVFLTKVVPLFFVLLLAWHALGLSWAYHRALAAVLDAFYPLFDPTRAVAGVVFKGDEFVFRLVAGGRRFGLEINALDATSNTATLIALYLASPVRGHVKPFLIFFGSALGLLFVVQAVTLVTVSQEALMSHPAIMASKPFSPAQIHWIPRYNVFYEEMGMFLFVLLLWLPYITWCIHRDKTKAGPPCGGPA